MANPLDTAARRVRWALASLGCSLASVALFLGLPASALDSRFALLWVLLPIALEVVAVVLGNRSLQPDPKGGPWHWLAVTAFVLPVALLFLALCGLVCCFSYSPGAAPGATSRMTIGRRFTRSACLTSSRWSRRNHRRPTFSTNGNLPSRHLLFTATTLTPSSSAA